jgi:hypothetical protein
MQLRHVIHSKFIQHDMIVYHLQIKRHYCTGVTMYTPTLGEIHTAISTNNRKKAASMLQVLIQRKPSADAWYLAAKLTNDRKKKIQYLRTAIFLESKHHKSLNYLRELGEGTGGLHHIVVGGLGQLLQEQANNSPLIRNLSPAMQRVMGVTIIALLAIVVGIVVSGLFSLRGPAISVEGPSTAVVKYVAQVNVLNHFYASDLDIVFEERARNEQIGKDIIRFEIRDFGNRARNIEIFVYDNVTAILADQSVLAGYEQSANVIAKANVVLVYPLDISEVGATRIVEIFETLQ